MKRQSKAVVFLLLAAMFCMMFANAAFAADSASAAWFTVNPAEDANSNGTTISVVTDKALTDGVITVTYDASRLTYKGISVDKDRVAMYSVNADKSGVIKISWVAPNAPASDASENAFIDLSFTGSADNAGTVSLAGSANDKDGNTAAISATNKPEESDSETSAEDTTASEPDTSVSDDSTAASDDSTSATDSSTPASDETSADKPASDTPTTGDKTPIALFAGLAIVSAASLAALCIVNRRRHER